MAQNSPDFQTSNSQKHHNGRAVHRHHHNDRNDRNYLDDHNDHNERSRSTYRRGHSSSRDRHHMRRSRDAHCIARSHPRSGHIRYRSRSPRHSGTTPRYRSRSPFRSRHDRYRSRSATRSQHNDRHIHNRSSTPPPSHRSHTGHTATSCPPARPSQNGQGNSHTSLLLTEGAHAEDGRDSCPTTTMARNHTAAEINAALSSRARQDPTGADLPVMLLEDARYCLRCGFANHYSQSCESKGFTPYPVSNLGFSAGTLTSVPPAQYELLYATREPSTVAELGIHIRPIVDALKHAHATFLQQRDCLIQRLFAYLNEASSGITPETWQTFSILPWQESVRPFEMYASAACRLGRQFMAALHQALVALVNEGLVHTIYGPTAVSIDDPAATCLRWVLQTNILMSQAKIPSGHEDPGTLPRQTPLPAGVVAKYITAARAAEATYFSNMNKLKENWLIYARCYARNHQWKSFNKLQQAAADGFAFDYCRVRLTAPDSAFLPRLARFTGFDHPDPASVGDRQQFIPRELLDLQASNTPDAPKGIETTTLGSRLPNNEGQQPTLTANTPPTPAAPQQNTTAVFDEQVFTITSEDAIYESRQHQVSLAYILMNNRDETFPIPRRHTQDEVEMELDTELKSIDADVSMPDVPYDDLTDFDSNDADELAPFNWRSGPSSMEA